MNKDKKFTLTDPLEQEIAEYLYEIKKLVKKAKALRLTYYRSLDKELKLFEMAKQICKLSQPQITRKKIMKVFKKYGRVCKHYREQIATEILEGE